MCTGIRRRALLRFGALGALAVLAGDAEGAHRTAAPGHMAGVGGFGQARSLLFISLLGGPSHLDLWDLKPDAPAGVRGEFRPTRTNVPGIEITEHLPKLARLADRFALIRSVTHEDNGHGSAMYTAYTGWPHPLPNTNPAPTLHDYPPSGSVVGCLRPPPEPLPPFVTLGAMQSVCGVTVGGQRAGFLGPAYDPFLVEQDPARPDFRVPELTLPENVAPARLTRRRSLVEAVDHAAQRAEMSGGMDVYRRKAFALLASHRVHAALDLGAETSTVRDRYGRTTQGQSLLLARRLIEAGVPCVTVNWARIGVWDNHGAIFPSLKNELLPTFDQSVSALLSDLFDRGLLEQTLVVLAGEFGRTPQVNKDAGRDHWAGCYTVAMAGGGVQGGRTHGSSDATGAYPATDPVAPCDVAATTYHCLGISPATELHDQIGRPLKLCGGEPIRSLL